MGKLFESLVNLSEGLTPEEQKQYDTLNTQRTQFANAFTALQKQKQADPTQTYLDAPIKQMQDKLNQVGTQIGALEKKRDGVEPGTAAKDDTSKRPASPAGGPVRVYGNVGANDIKALQTALKNKGGDVAKALGTTGPAKDGVDGFIGRATIDAIMKALNASATPDAKTATPGADAVLGADGVKDGQNPNIDQTTRDTATAGAPSAAVKVQESMLSTDPTLARIIQLTR